MKRAEERTVRTPLVVTIVVLCHTLAAGTAFLFIQGCATMPAPTPGPVSVEPPPEPMMPPTRVGLPAVQRPTPRPVHPKPAVAPMPASATGDTYVIQKGDSLSKIAARYGVSHRELAEINGIADPNKIKIGQTLTLPSHARKAPKPAPARTTKPATAPTMPGGEYVVQPGDVLSRIAKKHGVKVSDIKAANSLSSDLIRVGQKLVIPGVDTGASAVSTAASGSMDRVVELPDLSDMDPLPDLGSGEEAMDVDVVTRAVEPVEPELTAADEPLEYTVLTGDSLENIAKLFLVSKEDLVQLNNLSAGEDVKPGMKLLIPPPDL
jgi:LysM repeat protein